ncbi:MAG: hypothetical protein AAGI03_08010 [Pseudomonadota bacterium]
MIAFEDIQDIEEWLAPLDYIALWEAVEPWDVFADDDRDHCDGLIASGKFRHGVILAGLKAMVRLALTDRFGLKDRIYEPVDRQYLATTH